MVFLGQNQPVWAQALLKVLDLECLGDTHAGTTVGGPIWIGVFNATTGASSSSSLMVRTSHPNFMLVLVKQFWKRRLLRRDNRAPGELQSRYRACLLPSQRGFWEVWWCVRDVCAELLLRGSTSALHKEPAIPPGESLEICVQHAWKLFQPRGQTVTEGAAGERGQG